MKTKYLSGSFFFFFLSKFTFGFDGKGKILGRDKSYHGK